MQYNGLYLVEGPDPRIAAQPSSWAVASSTDNGSSWAFAEVAVLGSPLYGGLEVDLDFRALWPWWAATMAALSSRPLCQNVVCLSCHGFHDFMIRNDACHATGGS